MAKLDDDVTTFRVAMLTEDLSDDEQKAMRKTAERLEREWNSLTHVDKRVRLRGPLSLFAEWLEVNPQRTEPSKVARQVL